MALAKMGLTKPSIRTDWTRAQIFSLFAAIDTIEFARTVAVVRITMPRAMVRLSAGREAMSDEGQALAFLAGANSIFDGDRLLTTSNPGVDRDAALFDRLGLTDDLEPAARSASSSWA